MRTLFNILIFILCSSLSAQEKWSLEKCIDYAKEHNVDVQKQQFQNKITEEDITIAKGDYFPDAKFSATQGFSLGNSFNVSTGPPPSDGTVVFWGREPYSGAGALCVRVWYFSVRTGIRGM